MGKMPSFVSNRVGFVVTLFLGSYLRSVISFTVGPCSHHLPTSTRGVATSSIMILASTENSDMSFPEEPSDAKKQQEMMFESMSLKGADVIAQMEVPERAKRAMLAEAVEDRIFELTEVLEGYIDEKGMIAEQDREKAVEIAKQTKVLQIQYSELVSGGPSTILDSLNSME